MLQARRRRRIYWVHVVWIVNLFVCLVVAWWIFYRWRNQQSWTFYLFVFVLISATIMYLASMLLFPREGSGDESIDYKAHFYANHRALFAIFSMFALVDVADTLLKGIPHFLALGIPYMISSGALFHWHGHGCDHEERTFSSVLCHFFSRPDDHGQLSPFPDSWIKRLEIAACDFVFFARFHLPAISRTTRKRALPLIIRS